jgi:hypothetical protein
MPKARGDEEKGILVCRTNNEGVHIEADSHGISTVIEWKKDQVFNSNHLFELTTEDRTASKAQVHFGALAITWRRYVNFSFSYNCSTTCLSISNLISLYSFQG